MNGWVLVAVLFAALAGVGVVRHQPGLVARVGPVASARASAGGPGWWRGREGAVALRTRIGLAVPVAAVVALLIERPLLLALAVGAAAGIGVVVVVGRIESPEHHRRRLALAAAWPQTWELLAGCVDAGMPLSEACRAVAAVPDDPAAAVLGEVVARVDVGMAQDQALLELRDDPLAGRVAQDLARGLRSGTGMTAVLLEHAAEAREAHHAALQEAAKAVGVRSVLPLMTCYLPAFFLIGIVPVIGGALTALLSG